MVDKVRCSECNDRFATRGFHSHNRAMHDGAAEGLDPDDGGDTPEVEPDDAGEPDADAEGDADHDAGDAPELDLDEDHDEPDDHAEAFDADDTEVEGDPDAGDVTDEVEDEEADSRYPYNCGNCGHGLEYLGGEDREQGGKACPSCGERLFWSRVEA